MRVLIRKSTLGKLRGFNYRGSRFLGIDPVAFLRTESGQLIDLYDETELAKRKKNEKK